MSAKAFFSFHYRPDNWRAAQVRNAGMVEGNQPVADNDWDRITRGGDGAIQRWIDGQMAGRPCVVVLVGSETAGRKWINYEIEKAWNDARGLVGIHIHNLKDASGRQASRGGNPFDHVRLTRGGRLLSSIMHNYDPPYYTSTDVYAYIKDHVAGWAQEAISIRNNF